MNVERSQKRQLIREIQINRVRRMSQRDAIATTNNYARKTLAALQEIHRQEFSKFPAVAFKMTKDATGRTGMERKTNERAAILNAAAKALTDAADIIGQAMAADHTDAADHGNDVLQVIHAATKLLAESVNRKYATGTALNGDAYLLQRCAARLREAGQQ